jgi:hypothetical protein
VLGSIFPEQLMLAVVVALSSWCFLMLTIALDRGVQALDGLVDGRGEVHEVEVVGQHGGQHGHTQLWFIRGNLRHLAAVQRLAHQDVAKDLVRGLLLGGPARRAAWP